MHLGSRDKCHGLGGLHTAEMIPPQFWSPGVQGQGGGRLGVWWAPAAQVPVPSLWPPRGEGTGCSAGSCSKVAHPTVTQAPLLGVSSQRTPLGATISTDESERGTKVQTTARGARQTDRWGDRFKDHSDERRKVMVWARMAGKCPDYECVLM